MKTMQIWKECSEAPAAIAGAILKVNKYNGRFQGLINAATPTGFLTV